MAEPQRSRSASHSATAFTIALAIVMAPAISNAQGSKSVNATAAAQADFLKRVADYVSLQKKLESTLPKLPKEATPQQIDQDQRALAALVANARMSAKQGDLFTPEMQRVVHTVFQDVFAGQQGRDAKRYIHDEPHKVMPEINKRYPDTVPLSTMPLRVLEELPKLPDGLEYRFVDNHLILMDVHSHLILDYVPNAIPNDGGRK